MRVYLVMLVTAVGIACGKDASSGGLDSYSSFNVIFPADRASVVILCNFPGTGLPDFVLGPGGIRSIMLAR